ncbi:hypothetical protein [Nucisporomicrobium flavum]|uniref:hypothetical protein n=1 Tax=Nucisporomicrobium flavum TaxID=2785915 RepID=UPI0018F5894D|nr:hypothetical protein [Nucisporomicrobium flavum]
MSAEELRVAVQRLLSQVGHWETGRWEAAGPSGGTRADHVYGLVQRLADLGAQAEHRTPRPVPREPDMILPDQLRVMTDDLLAAGAPDDVLARAAADVLAVRKAL